MLSQQRDVRLSPLPDRAQRKLPWWQSPAAKLEQAARMLGGLAVTAFLVALNANW